MIHDAEGAACDAMTEVASLCDSLQRIRTAWDEYSDDIRDGIGVDNGTRPVVAIRAFEKLGQAIGKETGEPCPACGQYLCPDGAHTQYPEDL